MGCLNSKEPLHQEEINKVPPLTDSKCQSTTGECITSRVDSLPKQRNLDLVNNRLSLLLPSTPRPGSFSSTKEGGNGAFKPSPPNSNKLTSHPTSVDKGAELIESLSAIDGTAIEKIEAFNNLLVNDYYVQYASISAVTGDSSMFLVLTTDGLGAELLPKHTLLALSATDWSTGRVVATGAPLFWSSSTSDVAELPEDWRCLMNTESFQTFFAVPIKVGGIAAGVLNVGLTVDVEDQQSWWSLQLRLLAAVLAPHFSEANMRSKVSWLQGLHQRESVEQLGYAALKGLQHIFHDLEDLSFHLALALPGRPCAIMLSLAPESRDERSSCHSESVQRISQEVAKQKMAVNGFITTQTLLQQALDSGEVITMTSTKRYIRHVGSRADLSILKMTCTELPSCVKILPLIAVNGARLGGLYIASRIATDFGIVRREVIDLVKIMVPCLEKQLYLELNAKLLESCKPDKRRASNLVSDEMISESSESNTRDLLLGTKADKDALIQDLQQQIRTQLAKVYKGQAGPNGSVCQLEELELYEELGSGGFGTVFRGIWQGQVTAVKLVRESCDAGTLNGALELALLTSISHPNIIQIHTYFSDVCYSSIKFMGGREVPVSRLRREVNDGMDACQVMVLDFCDMGSLAGVLASSPLRHVHNGLPVMPSILTCLLEIASALQYLHSIGIVHYDLKPENVLLKSSTSDARGFTCKVGDFGLSHVLADGSYFNKHAEGTVTHLAPEAMLPGCKLTKTVDVYAFGIMMWELYTGQRPYAGLKPLSIGRKVSKDNLRPMFPGHTIPAYRELAEACWRVEKKERPSFEVVLERINMMMKEHNTVSKASAHDAMHASASQSEFPIYIL